MKYTGVGKSRVTVEHMKQSLFSYYCLLTIVLFFHANNCTLTFAHRCPLAPFPQPIPHRIWLPLNFCMGCAGIKMGFVGSDCAQSSVFTGRLRAGGGRACRCRSAPLESCSERTRLATTEAAATRQLWLRSEGLRASDTVHPSHYPRAPRVLPYFLVPDFPTFSLPTLPTTPNCSGALVRLVSDHGPPYKGGNVILLPATAVP